MLSSFNLLLLSLPAILSQVSSTVMQYIDASMVGSLGADASASIGLVSSTTWMFGGVAFAAITGFTVQVAHAIGAKDLLHARNIMKQGFIVGEILFYLNDHRVSISFQLPIWLKGTESIQYSASMYFLLFCAVSSFSTTKLFGNRNVAGIREYEDT